MKGQKKNRKKWPPYKYWTEFLMQDKEIYIGEHRTINHALASILMARDGKKHSERELSRFAEFLDRGRNKAIKMLWASGNERYVLGKGRVEAITASPTDKAEHLSRLGQQLDVKRIAVAMKSKGATENQCGQYGLPGWKEITSSRQRLLLGDSDFEGHIKKIESFNDDKNQAS